MDDFQGTIARGDQGPLDDFRLGIVVSEYNRDITDNLLQGAVEQLRERGIDDRQIIVWWVPGGWEIPLAAAQLASRVDALICLGCVIQGQTTHDQHINNTVSRELGRLAVTSGKPVGFGLLTTLNRDQARARAGGEKGNKGRETAEAVVAMLRLLARNQD